MRVYLDTGVFIDYLIYRGGHTGGVLRTKGRRNRTVQQLETDVTECLNKILKAHKGFTSSLTLYEAEEAMYSKLLEQTRGKTNRKTLIIPSSRAVIFQIIGTMRMHNLQLLDLSEDIIKKQLQEIEFHLRGVRAADSLHVATAIIHNADIIISTDKHLLNLNEIFTNQNGILIKCLDTNMAKNLL